MIDAPHDDVVLPAVEALPPADYDRWLAESSAHLAAYRQAIDAAKRGTRVAPYWLRPPAEIFEYEAERRTKLGDPTAPVWAALSKRSADLDEFEAIVALPLTTDPLV